MFLGDMRPITIFSNQKPITARNERNSYSHHESRTRFLFLSENNNTNCIISFLFRLLYRKSRIRFHNNLITGISMRYCENAVFFSPAMGGCN